MWHLEKLERLPWLRALTLVETLAFLLPGENNFVLVFYCVKTIKTVCATVSLAVEHKVLAIYPCMQGFLNTLRMRMVLIECAGFR